MRLEDVTLRCRIDDDERLQALASYEVVDTPSEATYETLVEAMQTYCRMPMAAIAFVDAERMWMKAQRGFATPVVPRSICFCSVCMHESAPLVVEDALRDARFNMNPLVTGTPGIRCYIGFPIFSIEGYALGSVCVVDTVPRTLLRRQMELLERTRDWVQAELETRRLRVGKQQMAVQPRGSTPDASRWQFAEMKASHAWDAADRMMQFLKFLPC